MLKRKPNSHSRIQSHNGLSLLEVLIAMVMTLIVLGAMMAAFSYGSREMHRGRAAIDLISRLQAADGLLRRDLDRLTVDVKPRHFKSSPPNGFLEIVDGPRRDYNGSDYLVDNATKGNNPHLGDNDDYISFTVKSEAEPFRNGSETSHYAEVHWYLIGKTLYRHVVPISAGSGGLARLGYRGVRRFHTLESDPHRSDLAGLSPSSVILSNVIAFDIQVYDPDASRYVVRAGPDAQDPIVDVAGHSEIGAVLGVANGHFSSVAQGAFVDLGKGSGEPGTAPILFNPPHQRYTTQAVYDTGTSQYDSDGVNDQGKNGVDDEPYFEEGEPNGIIDDYEEKASIPPYNVPLRGIKISIRVIEPNTNQVRQLTIIKSFIKE